MSYYILHICIVCKGKSAKTALFLWGICGVRYMWGGLGNTTPENLGLCIFRLIFSYMGEQSMITITDGNWIADLATMTCWNYANNIVVSFEKNENILQGKIKDIPIDLFDIWAVEPDGAKCLKNAVMEAEEVFLRAFFETEIEDNEQWVVSNEQ
jgi:hypothetical protein